MTSPDRPDEGHIADTQMFKRFVEEEAATERSGGVPRWLVTAAVAVLLVALAVVIWLLVR